MHSAASPLHVISWRKPALVLANWAASPSGSRWASRRALETSMPTIFLLLCLSCEPLMLLYPFRTEERRR